MQVQNDCDNIKKLLSTGAEQKLKQNKTEKVSKSIIESMKKFGACAFLCLDTYPRQNVVPCRDQSTNLHSKSIEWFLNDTSFR